MIVRRRLGWQQLLFIALYVVTLNSLWALVVYSLYVFADWTFIRLPFLPIATIGTAVAFYVGFKNNSAYERFWEGRKIWGGIVNYSRTWATSVLSYVQPGVDTELAREERRRLVYRQLAWINSLRVQLRKKSRFEDAPARGTRRRLDRDREHMRNDWDKEVGPFLDEDELAEVSAHANPATHMMKRQGIELARLVRGGQARPVPADRADGGGRRENYNLQGKCERIKNTPFPSTVRRVQPVVHPGLRGAGAVRPARGVRRPRHTPRRHPRAHRGRASDGGLVRDSSRGCS